MTDPQSFQIPSFIATLTAGAILTPVVSYFCLDILRRLFGPQIDQHQDHRSFLPALARLGAGFLYGLAVPVAFFAWAVLAQWYGWDVDRASERFLTWLAIGPLAGMAVAGALRFSDSTPRFLPPLVYAGAIVPAGFLYLVLLNTFGQLAGLLT